MLYLPTKKTMYLFFSFYNKSDLLEWNSIELNMDSSGDRDEIIFWFMGIRQYGLYLPPFIPVAAGIHREVLQGDFHNVKRRIESGESVNQRETQCNFSLLHMAVIKNDPEILEYLLGREGIEVDARCSEGRTPLFLATTLGHIKSVEKLIRAGSDVNITDYAYNSPLHMTEPRPDICHLLIRHSARIDAVNKHGSTLLHEAMNHESLEIVHMLLYYNADANVPDNHCRTPFMAALDRDNVPAQEALLEYVDDFNRASRNPIPFESTLTLALEAKSPFIKDIIERGADVNYGDSLEDGSKLCAFLDCLQNDVDSFTFKMVWERLRYNDSKNTINLLDFLDYVELVPAFLQVIIESDNFEPAVEFFSKGDNYLLFVNKFATSQSDFEQLTALTCRLLQYGFRATSHDIHTIFSRYGFCELFRMLLYMDNDLTRGWQPHMARSRLIFDVHYNFERVADHVNDIPKEDLVRLLEYSICPRLIDALTVKYSDDKQMSTILSKLPRVPSLVELARNVARKHIWHELKFTNACQFYTTIDHLDMPTLYKNILTFKRKIYEVEQ